MKTTLLEDAWDEVQNMCDTWVYEELGAELDRLTAELERYKQGVKVETIVHSNGSSWAGFDAYVHVQVPLAWSQQRVRVLVMPMEDKNE